MTAFTTLIVFLLDVASFQAIVTWRSSAFRACVFFALPVIHSFTVALKGKINTSIIPLGFSIFDLLQYTRSISTISTVEVRVGELSF